MANGRSVEQGIGNRESGIGNRELGTGMELSAISYQLSVISYQLSVISYQLLNKRCSKGTGGFPHSATASRQQVSIGIMLSELT
ncbi:hypothetical protein [Moorena producens]|uniref:hypothetical protein n=1 Tax=Moorena producens TaxID=1155739 RepID=UPI003C77E6E6